MWGIVYDGKMNENIYSKPLTYELVECHSKQAHLPSLGMLLLACNVSPNTAHRKQILGPQIFLGGGEKSDSRKHRVC